jgi:ubiquitin-fold modifier 1
MDKTSKIKFKITLASDPNLPYKIVEITEEAPFSSLIKYVSGHFGVNPDTSAVTTNSGVGIHPNQTAGTIFMKYGGDLKLIPRDQVGWK